VSNEEINKTIHEKVFGQCWHEWQPNSMGDRFACVKNQCLAVAQYGTPNKPDYCGNISDAFKVVEKMRESWRSEDGDGNFWRFTDCQQYGWTAAIVFGSDDGEATLFHEGTTTLPLAICAAALKVFEGENK
jgi:hypothetical protein